MCADRFLAALWEIKGKFSESYFSRFSFINGIPLTLQHCFGYFVYGGNKKSKFPVTIVIITVLIK